MMAPAAAAAAVSSFRRHIGRAARRHSTAGGRDAESTAAARRFEDEWLGEARSAILLVPSVVVGLELVRATWLTRFPTRRSTLLASSSVATLRLV
jgi:RES domain-containing protein